MPVDYSNHIASRVQIDVVFNSNVRECENEVFFIDHVAFSNNDRFHTNYFNVVEMKVVRCERNTKWNNFYFLPVEYSINRNVNNNHRNHRPIHKIELF